MTIFWIVFFIVLCLGSAAFFSGSEIAFISVNRIKLRSLVNEKSKPAILVHKFLKYPQRFLATTLVGTNISYIISTALFTFLICHLLGFKNEWLVTLIMAPVAIVFSELIPKALFRQHADRLVLKLGKPFSVISKVLFPVTVIVNFATDLILHLFRKKREIKKSPFVTKEELMYLIAEGEKGGILTSYERSIVRKIFDLGRTTVKEVMVPFNKIISLSGEATIRELKKTARTTGLSRFPIYRQDKNNLIGLVNILDVLFEDNEDKKIMDFIRAPFFIESDKITDDSLFELQSKKQVMAIVIDRDKKNTGIVTIEDLVPV